MHGMHVTYCVHVCVRVKEVVGWVLFYHVGPGIKLRQIGRLMDKHLYPLRHILSLICLLRRGQSSSLSLWRS